MGGFTFANYIIVSTKYILLDYYLSLNNIYIIFNTTASLTFIQLTNWFELAAANLRNVTLSLYANDW